MSSKASPESQSDHALFIGRVRRRLAILDMNQKELAHALGRAQASVSEWLVKGAWPGGDAMVLLPKALRCSGHWLLTDEGPMERGGAEASIEGVFVNGAIAAITDAVRLLEEQAATWRGRALPAGARDAAALAAAAEPHLRAPRPVAQRNRKRHRG